MFVATPVPFGDDPVFELHREASARQASGRRCINATLGVLMDERGELAVLPTVAEVMRTALPHDWAPYASAIATDALTSAVMDDCLGAWPQLRAHAFAIATPGATGALRVALGAFLAPDQECLTSSLHWASYASIAQASQRRLATFELFDESLSCFNIADFEHELARSIATQGRALVVINDPCHNPTGFTMSAGDWAAVAAVLSRHGARAPVTVVLDAVYAAFSANGSQHALAALEPLIDQLLLAIAWSASKSFTCYGLRVGALVAVQRGLTERDEIHRNLVGHARGSWGNCNRGGLAAIARLLTDPQLRDGVERDRSLQIELLRARSELFRDAAQKCGLVCAPYGGGFFTVVFVHAPQLLAARLRARGIFLVPMPGSLRIALSGVQTADVSEIAYALRAEIDELRLHQLGPLPRASSSEPRQH